MTARPALGALVLAACGSAPTPLPAVVGNQPPPNAHPWPLYRMDSETYLPLDAVSADPVPPPAHGVPTLSHPQDGVNVAVAEVSDPGAFRALRGRKLFVDGACVATIDKFYIVNSVWAGEGEGEDPLSPEERAKANASFAAGLVDGTLPGMDSPRFGGRVDGCRGVYAMDRPWSPITTADVIDDPQLAELARAAFVVAAAKAPRPPEWKDSWTNGARAMHGTWYDGATFSVRIVRHPKTGVLWASVHATRHECCDSVHANVWGLLRISTDHTTATVEQLRTLSRRAEIDALVDLDGVSLDILARDENPMPIAGDDVEAVDALRRRTSCPC